MKCAVHLCCFIHAAHPSLPSVVMAPPPTPAPLGEEVCDAPLLQPHHRNRQALLLRCTSHRISSNRGNMCAVFHWRFKRASSTQNELAVVSSTPTRDEKLAYAEPAGMPTRLPSPSRHRVLVGLVWWCKLAMASRLMVFRACTCLDCRWPLTALLPRISESTDVV